VSGMPHAPTAGELVAVGVRAARTRRNRRARVLARRAWQRAAPWLLGLPLAALLLVLVTRNSSLGASLPGFWVLAAAVLLPPLLLAAAAAARAFAQPADPRDGLARLDRELGSEGRLQAAHEFLAHARRTAFMDAAVEDALPALARARAHELAPPPRRARSARDAVPALLGLLLAALAATLRGGTGAPAPLEPTLTADAEPATAEAAARAPLPPEAPAAPPQPEERAAAPREPGAAAGGAEQKPQPDAPQEPKSSRGLTGAGAAATPSQASASSESQGFPSAKADSKEAADPGKSATPKPRKPKEPSAPPPPPKTPTEESGSTAGKGVGHGSSRNPGATDWESKDQTSTDEEDPLDDDEDVDDEDSESEARGGLQPSLRDRRPAVNRDLRIAFGNRPNPDANGRGAGGEQKKSRGVASLVLGVPIPDHVKGKPNPGRTKITQERVEPKAEDAPFGAAVAHAPRSGPSGNLSSFDLEPWMRALVRGYFDRGGSSAANVSP
jgi:hypothetical protein